MHKNKTSEHLKYPDVSRLLDAALSRMRNILGERLVGLYLYGSLAAGDFDYEISDVDLLAVTAAEIDEEEFNALDKMQRGLIEDFSRLKNRIEIAYVSTAALKTFKTRSSRIAIISPGEPFHRKEAGKDWLINWYSVRENGVTLFGVPPASVIEPISKEEFIKAVREQAFEWRDYVKHAEHSRPYQAYVILTICRAFYAVKNDEQVSKKKAARWTQERFPEFSQIIENAFKWREAWREENINHEATFPETRSFVLYIINQIDD